MIDARVIILGKRAAAESVGGREDGGHRRGGSGGRSEEGWGSGRGRGEREDDGREQVGWATRLFPFPANSRL